MASVRKNRKSYEETAPIPEPPPDTDVQAGDSQGLSDLADADSESVRELISEGQAFEAAVVSGVENAPPADVSEVRTHEVPEDDVPEEYLEQDPDSPREA
jgi:hypothetical protein